jgi:hypothetical protein
MWRRMVLVGIGDSDIMGRLVAACRGLSLVIVPEWPAKSEQPSERIKQRAREEKLRKLCAAYDRVTLLEPDAVPEGVFDAAVLLGLGDEAHSGPDVDEPTIAPKRRGGRPKGSRNKAKVGAMQDAKLNT